METDKQIEKELRAEAKKRGFVKGATFLGCEGADKNVEIQIGKEHKIKYHKKYLADCESKSWGLYCGDSWIYFGHTNKWGKLIQSK